MPTLIDAARARGLATAAVSWPVSVGMTVDYLVPEYWRPNSSHPSDALLLRAISTPGLLDAIETAQKSPLAWPFKDKDLTGKAVRSWSPTALAFCCCISPVSTAPSMRRGQDHHGRSRPWSRWTATSASYAPRSTARGSRTGPTS